MRHLQPRLVDHGIPVQDQIQIERSRRADVRALPAVRSLDRKQAVEQGPCGERGPTDGRGVQEARLRRDTDRRGVEEGRELQAVYECGEMGCGGREMGFAVAEIAPERDRDANA